jgi:hypothetical protein
MDDVKSGSRWRAPGRARLWAKGGGKVNQGRPLKRPPSLIGSDWIRTGLYPFVLTCFLEANRCPPRSKTV